MIKIASWNVNSVRARLPILQNWLNKQNPDMVLLQETKCQNEVFPASEIEDLGYNLAIFGQKTYNGVAILSKFPIEDIVIGIPNFKDESARYIEAVTNKMRIASIYIPNGQEVDSEKFHYKLELLNALYKHFQNTLKFEEACIFGGDFNIAPHDIDVYDSIRWFEHTSCTERERQLFRSILNLSLTDIFRLFHPQKTAYTWWDYRHSMYKKNHGLRIDHLLLNSHAVDRAIHSEVDEYVRTLERTSDHAPIWCTLED